MVCLTSFTCNVSETGLLDCAKQWNHVSIGCSHSQDVGGVISDPQLCKCKLGFAAHVDSFLGGILGWGGLGGGRDTFPSFSNFHTTHTIESIQQLYVDYSSVKHMTPMRILNAEVHISGVGRCFRLGGLHNKEIRACVLWFKGVHVRNHLFLWQFQCGSGLLLCL